MREGELYENARNSYIENQDKLRTLRELEEKKKKEQEESDLMVRIDFFVALVKRRNG